MREAPAPVVTAKEDSYETTATRHKPPGRSWVMLLTGGHAWRRPPASKPRHSRLTRPLRASGAAAAQTGLVKGVEGNDEKGKRLCKVQIVDETGKRHKLQVDVQTNQVVKPTGLAAALKSW